MIIGTIAMAAASAKPAVYTASQAKQGAKVYSAQCSSCHGDHLQGKVGPTLKGTAFQQMISTQNLNGQQLLHFISTQMPYHHPGKLTPKDYEAVTAYILKENDYPAGSTKLTPHSAKLKRLQFSHASHG